MNKLDSYVKLYINLSYKNSTPFLLDVKSHPQRVK